MANGPTPSPCQLEPGRTLNLDSAVGLVWRCAWEAVVLAFLVRLFGGIALEMVGGLWHDMAPGAPPGFGSRPLPEAEPSASVSFGFVRQNSFILLAVAFFLIKCAARFAHYSRSQQHRQAAAWAHGLLQRAGDNWFRLIVGNAFGAFIAAIILHFTQQFTFTNLVWQFFVDLARPLTQGAASVLSHFGLFERLGALFHWYSENRFKLTFWFFYTTSICDDLGLPNFKTLARFAWRRFTKRHAAGFKPKESPGAANGSVDGISD